MDWLKTLFSGENSAITLVTIVVGLAIALVLLAWVFRKIAGDGALKAGRSRQPRLSVTDAAIVDEKRRLVLVRRDNVEHLIMIGGPTDFLIEQNIARVPLAHHAPERTVERTPERALAGDHAPPAHGEPAGNERGGERGGVRQAPPRAARPAALPEQQVAEQPAGPMQVHSEAASFGQRDERARAAAPQVEEMQAAVSEPEFSELELTAADLEAEIAADDQRENERAAFANGHDEVAVAAQPEIEIDLDELQMEIDRSQGGATANRIEGPAVAKAKVAAPSLDVAESVEPQPARKSEARAVRAEAKPAPEVRPASRVKSMEDEMQRLLEELSGPARN